MATYPRPSPDVSRHCEQRGFSSCVRGGGFGHLLDRWTNIVADVETGYRGLFDEYLNEPSVHDNFVYAYSVDCEGRRLVLHTAFRDRPPQEFTDVVFRDVVAHHFEHVLPGNILFDVPHAQPTARREHSGQRQCSLNRVVRFVDSR